MKVPVRLITNPRLGRVVAFDPQRLSLAPLSEAQAHRLGRFADAGHLDGPLTSVERMAWQQVERLLEKRELRPLAEGNDKITQLVLGNTYHCNMGCTYCYNEMDLKPAKGSEVRAGMSIETACVAIDSTIANLDSGDTLSLMFVGGEPFLEREVMYRATEHAHIVGDAAGVAVKIVVYTNGTLLTRHSLQWISDNHISIVVSLDGPPDTNTNRLYLSGRPTTAIVLRNIRRLHESESQRIMRVRAVSTPTTPLVALHEYLRGLGFNEIHVQPMYDNKGISGSTDHDMLGLLEWWSGLMREGIVLDVMPFAGFVKRLLSGGAATGTRLPCQAGRNAVTIGPDGRVYSCHHAIEEPEYLMGHIASGLPSSQTRSQFYRDVDDRQPCSDCWAKHLCGGECYHRNSSASTPQFSTLPEVCRERKSLIGATLDAVVSIMHESPRSLVDLLRMDLTRQSPRDEVFAARDLQDFGA